MSSSRPDLASRVGRNNPRVTTGDIDAIGLSGQEKYKNLKRKRYLSNTMSRVNLSIWSSITVSIWLSAVVFVLVNNYRGLCLELSDTVLVTLLGTTTVNVLGLMFIVLRGLFNEKEIDPGGADFSNDIPE